MNTTTPHSHLSGDLCPVCAPKDKKVPAPNKRVLVAELEQAERAFVEAWGWKRTLLRTHRKDTSRHMKFWDPQNLQAPALPLCEALAIQKMRMSYPED